LDAVPTQVNYIHLFACKIHREWEYPVPID
jgi:hypothetical protein